MNQQVSRIVLIGVLVMGTCIRADEGDVKWIDGRDMPYEGRGYEDVSYFYDRLPAGVTLKVNQGVLTAKHNSTGLQIRFTTDSNFITVKYVTRDDKRGFYHMSELGASGIDIYRQDSESGKWFYVTSSHHASVGQISKDEPVRILRTPWAKGEACLVNLPNYNGIRKLWVGIAKNATIGKMPPHRSGIDKPVVSYGTSITHGCSAFRPGLAFPSIIGCDLDVPIINLGFSGSGLMELEMSEHLARIDASCYVMDCVWNMQLTEKQRLGGSLEVNYERFLRNLRAKRPKTPILLAEQSDVFYRPGSNENRFKVKNNFVRIVYDRLIAEGWLNLYYLPSEGMYSGNGDETVDGIHPNDLGMVSLAHAYGTAVKEALGLK